MTVPARSPSVPPRVGMIGAGQLAQMTHQAAIGLGVELRVLAADEGEPAVLAGASHLLGVPTDGGALRAMASDADVLTFDHENVAPDDLTALEEEGFTLEPSAGAKLLAQDKAVARRTLAEAGFPVPPYEIVRKASELERFGAEHGWPVVGKTPRGGYDGRGVFVLDDLDAARKALESLPEGMLVEPKLEIELELAVLVARTRRGDQVVYPVVETVQEDGMCREITAPAPVDEIVAAQAAELATSLAERFGATGVMAVELFVTPAGLLVNELALRPHNSGHYTIEGCTCSQFEQHLRAVLGWPLGPAGLREPAVTTVNVVGPQDGSDPRSRAVAALEAVPEAHLHLYAKEARPGRKLGHVTVCGADPREVRAAAHRAAAVLEGGR